MFKYEKPFMEVVEFENEVITTSGPDASNPQSIPQEGVGVRESMGSVIVNPEVQAITEPVTGSDKL